ncbi:GDNF-inducible zinc finger protein 1 [Paramormyrops kingsleyae]|uniref:GDNF inducible zinc finger protein 1 n=1 Tax=Paramormyrops kingsleyae TaxID=1676925 RepID=A0A3B3RI40_9TELE|nr:GDNF-inducible zinc finger protein 1-like [Paramormyrops kingsleyae]XP_023655664.1 GDNF-inducible zinc finger protein 1-like [Paramormyrops kingsleyae]
MSDFSLQLVSEGYHENLLRQMCQLRTMGHLCDIAVQVDSGGQMETFKAHRVVLAASSGYFRSLLLEKDPPSEVCLDNLSANDFASFLEFVYSANLEFVKERTCSILEMAKALQCQDLVEACSGVNKFMVSETDSVAYKTDPIAHDGKTTANTQSNVAASLQLEEPSSDKATSEEFSVVEKPDSPNRTVKNKEITPEVQGRRLSNRLAGRKVCVNPPKRKYGRRLKEQHKARQGSGKTQSERAPQEARLGAGADGEKRVGDDRQASDELPDLSDTDELEAAEDDPNDLDFQSNEGEEEGNKGKKRKRSVQFRCEKCQRSFHYGKSYLKHLMVSHGDLPEVTYRCGTCQQTFANRCNLKIHERHVHSDERLFPCDVCGKAFKRKKDVKRHTRQVHEGGADRHFCPICGKALSSKTALVLHERTHTGDRPYQCGDCGAKFSQSSALKTHRRTHTGEKPFSCDQCDARFTQNHMLAYHKRCHTGEKPYMCESCGKSFASKEYLKHHARIHSGSKPYKCEICERAFAQRNSLHQHMKTHTGERPYSCNECGKQFTQLNALQRHNRIHTGEKPYMCVLCNRTFTDKSTVRRHTMTHDKDIPWKNYLVVLKGNVESGPKRIKQDGTEEKEDESELDGAGKGVKAETTTTVQAESVTISGDWSTAGHGAIALVSHPTLGGFTVIQTDVQASQLQSAGGADPLPLPVTVSIPLPVSLSVPISAPLSVPVSVPLSACTPVADEVCVTVQSSELDPEADPEQVSEIAAVGHLGVTEDVPVETMSVEMEVTSESVSDTAM